MIPPVGVCLISSHYIPESTSQQQQCANTQRDNQMSISTYFHHLTPPLTHRIPPPASLHPSMCTILVSSIPFREHLKHKHKSQSITDSHSAQPRPQHTQFSGPQRKAGYKEPTQINDLWKKDTQKQNSAPNHVQCSPNARNASHFVPKRGRRE
ncbi:hypothetical protein K458DRAFT_158782 [Lentithecium fluviatile CBS 122367]|uniref:Uncharacterized protein n=1 Tax=Lentithecium fluviatile CBS 122367 TaxID=1168545 RepID=A0A6G1IHM4_9PLEO|nr:hypothetical protein K458DRAFT_158782 [Lentithecium fluviatile CBS 122367]